MRESDAEALEGGVGIMWDAEGEDGRSEIRSPREAGWEVVA